jgi:broad specificity phosphatase PhoE
MSELFLVRHGQASFDADDYDQLSEVGYAQAAILADYWQAMSQRFDHSYCGSLKRQRQTANEVAKCIDSSEPTVLEGLNEYSSHEILAAYREQHAQADGFAAGGNMKEKKFFQRFLEAACSRWVNGQLEGQGMELFRHFKERVNDAVMQIMNDNAKGRKVVVATSGGVIALAVQSVLQMPDEQAIKLNWMVYNSSITRINFSGSRVSLSMFNSIPHLEQVQFADKITYR